jgi:hypothetical protein
MRHPLTLLCMLIFIVLVCAGCSPSPRSSTTHNTGPGAITIGETRDTIEHRNSDWKLDHTIKNTDDSETVTYRDWHWSFAYGVTHGSEFHHLTYRDSILVKWVSNSSQTNTKQ